MAQLRRWGPWAALLLVALVGLAVGLNQPGRPSLDARAQSIEQQVRCPVCNGETVAESQAAPSVEIRSQIRQELQAGESENQILAGLVRSYGAGILEKPQTSGIGVVVWVLPVIAVVVAAGGLVLVLRRWRAAAGTAPEATVAGAPAGPSRARVSAPTEPPERATGAPAGATSPETAEPQGAPAGGGVATAVVPDPGPVPTGEGPVPSGGRPVAGDPAPPGGRDRPTGPPRWGRGPRWALAGVGVAVVAAGASWAVVAASGTRLPGETVSGQVLPSQAMAQDLQAAAADEQKNDLVGAIKEYEKVLKSAPKQVEALSGMGWLLAQTGQPGLLKQGLAQLVTAEQTDPSYAPAHLYRGLALLGEANYSASIPELQWYLAHNPDPKVVAQVKRALTEAQAGAAAAAPTTTTGPGAAPVGG